MGFFESDIATQGKRTNRTIPKELLERQGCRLCPLDRVKINAPKMKPIGPTDAQIYVLGEAPDADADNDDDPFSGRVGKMLRSYIPRKYRENTRYSNSIHCFTGRDDSGDTKKPDEVNMACCRGRIVEDVERCKPKVIIGLGNFALLWAIGEARLVLWRGRRLPIKIGSHTCWFYPTLHPAEIIKRREERQWSDEEKLFEFDMQRVFHDLHNLPEPVVHSPAEARAGVTCIEGGEPGALKTVVDFLRKAGAAPVSGVDYETNGRRPYATGAKILSCSVALPDAAIAFAWDHREAEWSKADRRVLEVAWLEFLNSQTLKAVHFLGFEQEWSGVMFGIDVIRAGRWADTATAAAVFDERVGDHKDGPLSLGFQTMQNFGINIKKLTHVNRASLEDEPLSAVLPYNGVDAKYHLSVWLAYKARLEDDRRAGDVYIDMVRRVPTCVLTQIKGVPTDLGETKRLAAKYAAELAPIDAEIFMHQAVLEYNKARAEPFNPGSGPQVKDLFTNFLKIPLSGSADENALKETGHPMAPLILKHRKITKRKSTYVDSWMPGENLWPDGLLHQTLNTLFAETGRSSASEPNTQNVVKRDEVGKEVRKQVKARPGYIFVSADHGQIQARNIAMESRDKTFCKALWEDYDVHGYWADRLAYAYPDRVGGIDEYKGSEKVRKTFRNDVKNQFVFPNFFGAQDKSVAGYLGIPVEALGPEYKQFWHDFSGVKEWQERLKRVYRENGYTESLTGVRRHAPLTPNMVINSPIQADEAVIVFDGFNRLSERNDPSLQAIMEIHDDLVFELPIDQVYEYTKIIVDDMLACPFEWVNVPLIVEVSIGADWYSMHEEHKFRSDVWNGRPFQDRAYA